MFDSQIYDWSSVTVQVGAKVLTGIQGVTYKMATEKEPVYGKGAKPLAIKAGNEAFTGEITLLQNELESLIATAPQGKLSKLKNLLITVSYDNTPQGGELVTDQLIGVEFNEVEKALKQNEKFMAITLPIMFLDLNYNV